MTQEYDFEKEWTDRQKRKRDFIIGPGPFFCRDCGKQMIEGGHLMESFFMCPDAGEFTPGSMLRVEIDGVSYWCDPEMKKKDLEREREYFKQSRDAHKYAKENPGARLYTG